ncbi:hypothetical protein U8527_04730 [Kordia algicida OT-1]|uniref:DUF2975 domain-containing protein n=1 Tax=Kordia algicida OT-1 TaxID=391587 RepID=A9DM50_9FLAO|nr:hypothetical protein [Kordia algicida]EDP97629.1 hypothetical protein KAOT1_20742 [Kordia algicida OT-1]
MRFIKILLIAICSLIILGMSYAIWEQDSFDKLLKFPLFAKIIIGLVFVLSTLNILYHIKSFRFYRRAAKQNLHKDLSKILWIGTLCFSAYMLFLVGLSLYNNADKYLSNNYESGDILIMCFLISLAFLGFLEVSILRKRIKRLKIEHDSKDEISDIGNSTL